MKPNDPHFVAAEQPINSRMVVKKQRAAVISPALYARLTKQQTRGRLGAGLAETLYPSVSKGAAPNAKQLFGAITIGCSGVAGFLGLIQNSFALASLAIAGATLGVVVIFFARRVKPTQFDAQLPLFDQASLLAFDRLLDQSAPELSEEVVLGLRALKQQLLEIVKLAQTAPLDAYLTQEDRMYLHELLRRYLPDSLQSYLLIPAHLRSSTMLAQEQTPQQLLLAQLDLFASELKKKEGKLGRSAAENLLRQQRFLEDKNKLS
ncbi:MAG: hypothetical protein K2P84_06410 [Undibacterium sp.]|nr:hypothetical protein [Undibacterium sp.]